MRAGVCRSGLVGSCGSWVASHVLHLRERRRDGERRDERRDQRRDQRRDSGSHSRAQLSAQRSWLVQLLAPRSGRPGRARARRAPTRGTPRSRRVRGVSPVHARRPARVDRTAPAGWYVCSVRV